MAHTVADLPYAYDALEPYIDQETMHIHHNKHHVAYVNNLNAALEAHPAYADWSVEKLLSNLTELPAEIQTPVRNNAGGHLNHSLFWQWLSPNGGGVASGEIGEAINAAFGSFEDFKQAFKAAATTRFGSGWAFLVLDKGSLKVISTANQDSPLLDGQQALLGLDVWEHAYYLKYHNVRPDYIEAFFNVVNWDFVNVRYAAVK